MVITCQICGNEFEAKRKDTMYCPSCKQKQRSQDVMRSRKKKHPEIEIGVGSGNSKLNHGATHGSYTTGVSIYRKLISVNACAYCKSTKNLLVHHLDEDRTHNTAENLICLCKRCHQNLHTKRDPQTGKYLAK